MPKYWYDNQYGKATSYSIFAVKFKFGTIIILFAFWLALSHYLTPLLLSFGIISCLLTIYIIYRMDIADHEGKPLPLISIRILPFHGWLIFKILQSNIAVARLALSPKVNLTPRVLRVSTKGMSDMERITYANSITLTPGTLTMEVEDDYLNIHALNDESAEDLATGEMERKVRSVVIHSKQGAI